MKEVTIAIIGCGRIAEHHCRSMLQISGIRLIAVCDLIEHKAKQISKKYNVPWYSNYRQMLRDNPEINTVAIVTPSGMHFEHGMEILRDYKKNIIVEKPTFMNPDEMNSAYKEADKNNLKIFPVFQNR